MMLSSPTFIDASDRMSPSWLAERIIAQLEILKVRVGESSPAERFWLPLARMLESSLPSGYSFAALATRLGIELSSQGNEPDQVARVLVDRIAREGLDILPRVVAVLMADLEPRQGQLLVELLAALALNSQTAADILEESQKREASPVIFLNCSHLLTVELYVRRAWMGLNQPVVVALPVISKEDDLGTFLHEMEQKIALELRIDPSDLHRLLPDIEQPVYAIIRAGEVSVNELSKIKEIYPDIFILLYNQMKYVNTKIFSPDRMPIIDARLDEKEEEVFVSEFRRLLDLVGRFGVEKKSWETP
jgi:hypothetical protein